MRARSSVSTPLRCSAADPASALAIFRSRSRLPHSGTVCSSEYLTRLRTSGSPVLPAARMSQNSVLNIGSGNLPAAPIRAAAACASSAAAVRPGFNRRPISRSSSRVAPGAPPGAEASADWAAAEDCEPTVTRIATAIDMSRGAAAPAGCSKFILLVRPRPEMIMAQPSLLPQARTMPGQRNCPMSPL